MLAPKVRERDSSKTGGTGEKRPVKKRQKNGPQVEGESVKNRGGRRV